MELDTTKLIETGIAVWGSREMLSKLLGPTCDYIGGEFQGIAKKCNINLSNIFKKTARQLGQRLDEPGLVSPRVLKHIVDEGRFCEDDLTAEYYGGILASSKTRNKRDDRGVTLLAQLKTMSVYQLRLHYISYTLFQTLFHGCKANICVNLERESMKIFIPINVTSKAMAITAEENHSAIVTHAMFGLAQRELIEEFASGQPDTLKKHNPRIDKPGLIFQPTVQGSELFLWANGIPNATGQELFDIPLFPPLSGVEIPEGSITFTELNRNNKPQV